MTINDVLLVVTAFVTYVFGILAKKFKWVKSKYIPIQNLIIGIVAGILVHVAGVEDNLASAIIMCAAAAFTAGGVYDLTKTKVGE
jgi:hypothetical protein